VESAGVVNVALGMAHLSGVMEPGAPGPETMQADAAPVALYVMSTVLPFWMRVALAVMETSGTRHAPPALTEDESLPPGPVQVRVYGPAVEMDAVPLGLFPVEKPPPVMVVAFVLLQVRVAGTVSVGETERLQVGAGGGATVTFVHAPQLSPSLLSAMTPAFPAEDLSAQARTYQVPEDGKAYALLAVLEPPAESAAELYVPMSVALVPLESVARWKRSVKAAPVAAVAFEILALKVTETPWVAVVGVTAPAVRFGFAAAFTVRLFEQFTVLLCVPDVTVTLAVFVPVALYAFAAVFPVPESESVPLQEYAYVPVPPVGLAVQVALPPAVMDAGETEQEAERTGYTVTLAVAVAEPTTFVQVSVYVVVVVGETDFVPDAGELRVPTPLFMEAELVSLVQE